LSPKRSCVSLSRRQDRSECVSGCRRTSACTRRRRVGKIVAPSLVKRGVRRTTESARTRGKWPALFPFQRGVRALSLSRALSATEQITATELRGVRWCVRGPDIDSLVRNGLPNVMMQLLHSPTERRAANNALELTAPRGLAVARSAALPRAHSRTGAAAQRGRSPDGAPIAMSASPEKTDVTWLPGSAFFRSNQSSGSVSPPWGNRSFLVLASGPDTVLPSKEHSLACSLANNGPRPLAIDRSIRIAHSGTLSLRRRSQERTGSWQ